MLNRVSQGRERVTREAAFPAPVKGWVQSGNVATAGRDQAEVLDNFFPTAQSARLRGGSTQYADIGDSVVRLMVYSADDDTLFAATADGIYNADRINGGGAAFADVAGLGSGDWSAAQMATAGGLFMVAVNGVDHMQYYNGSTFYPVSTVAVVNLGYDALTSAFSVGETVTGGTSGATATVLGIVQTSATTGTLRLGTVTGGPYQDNEALTSAGGAATANGASAAGSAITLTGVATTALTQVWSYKERLFFVEKNSQSVWFLPVEAIGGAASEIPLGSIFRRGGNVVFGAAWSLDSGAGLDDVCIIVSSNGEIAVFDGDDPASSSTWALVGVYQIAPPLNKHAFFQAGGDLAILTADGIIPVSEALKKDRAALQAVAISLPIEDAWKSAVADATTNFPVTPTLWQSQAMLLIGVPGTTPAAFVANARTGAWCRYTGWDVRCGAVANGALFFGTSGGFVMEGESGGSDDGIQYTGTYVPKFSTCGVNSLKSANHAMVTFRAAGTPVFSLFGHANYQVDSVQAPPPIVPDTSAVWGSGVWGTFVWGGSSATKTYTNWETISANGEALAPGVYVTSSSTVTPIFEILATKIRFEVAGSF